MMRELTIDAKNWVGPNDLYDAFFEAVGAPPWHGRNFDALRDSIAVGQINKIEVPYVIRIKNYSSIGEGAKGIAGVFVMLIKDLRQAGCPVDIEIAGGA